METEGSTSRGTQPPETAALTARTDVKGSGPTVVLVPGGLTGWLTWEPHAKELSADHQVIRTQLLSVDLGLQAAPLPDGYSIVTEIEALGRALDGLGVDEADFVGWSYGGQIALYYALEHPGRVRSLSLVEPATWSLLEGKRQLWERAMQFERMMESYAGDDVSEEQLEYFLHEADTVPHGVDPRTHERWPVWLEHRRSLRIGGSPNDLGLDRATLKRFEPPMLLFMGEGSSDYGREAVIQLAEAVPHARLEELPGAHVLPVVSMERFLEILREFWGHRSTIRSG